MSPTELLAWGWPQVRLYSQQVEILESVWWNKETIVPAGNKLGKDFVAGFATLGFFLTRYPVRVVTTSATDDHLRVLWGEIGNFIRTCKYPLDHRQGGPLIINHQDIRKVWNGQKCPKSYLIGMVASADSIAAMQGHHVTPDSIEQASDGVPRSMFAADESSSVPQPYFEMAETWAQSSLIFGNCWPCDNKFRWSVKGRPGDKDRGGDLLRDRNEPRRGYLRKIVRIKAEDSPNVQLAMIQSQRGVNPTGEILVPGVKGWEEYQDNRNRWDPAKQCVSLDADWYEGAEVRLFPQEWLLSSQRRAYEMDEVTPRRRRRARAIGVDPAEGGDKTAMAAVDEWGLIELVSRKTPNTADIPREVKAFARKHGLEDSPEMIVLDRGGGGKQHADLLREDGWEVRTVSFGDSVADDPRSWGASQPERLDLREDRSAFANRRAQLWGELAELLDPGSGRPQFGIPAEYSILIDQLRVIPKTYDKEGKLLLIPKNRRPGMRKGEPTLTELIGHSPDEADAVTLAVHGMLHEPTHSGYVGIG